jgi:hypothetical protein
MSSAPDKPAPACPKCASPRVKRLIYGLIDYDLLLELGPEGPDFELGWLRPPVHDWHCADCGHEWREPG